MAWTYELTYHVSYTYLTWTYVSRFFFAFLQSMIVDVQSIQGTLTLILRKQKTTKVVTMVWFEFHISWTIIIKHQYYMYQLQWALVRDPRLHFECLTIATILKCSKISASYLVTMPFIDHVLIIYAAYTTLIFILYIFELIAILKNWRNLFKTSFYRIFSVMAVVVSWCIKKKYISVNFVRSIHSEHCCMSSWNLYFPSRPLSIILCAVRCNECRQRLDHRCTLVSRVSKKPSNKITKTIQHVYLISSGSYYLNCLSEFLGVLLAFNRFTALYLPLRHYQVHSTFQHFCTPLIFSSGANSCIYPFHCVSELHWRRVGFFSTIQQGLVVR